MRINFFSSYLLRVVVFLFFFSALSGIIGGASVTAREIPVPFPSNSGASGLFDMPSARLMPDWSMRVHYSKSDPFSNYGVSVTFLPWLEVTGRLIEINSLFLESGRWEGYGNYKDKAVDFKLRLLEEDVWPALAIGATDIHGTSLFASRYLVAGKMFGPLDITLGLGQGILAGETIDDYIGGTGGGGADNSFPILTAGNMETRLFGGAELRITDNLSLLAEYSSIDYEILKGIDEPAASPVNIGLKYRMGDHIELAASYQRGEVFSGSVSFVTQMKPQGMLPWKKQPIWHADDELRRQAADASNEGLASIIQAEVVAERFSNVRVSVADATVWLEIENPTYQSNMKALGRALRTICSFLPDRIKEIYISLKSKDLIMLTLTIGRRDFEAFVDGRLTSDGLRTFITFNNVGTELRDDFSAHSPGASAITPLKGSKKLSFWYKPSWKTLLNDPSGFMKHDLSIMWKGRYYPWAGGIIKGMVKMPLYNNISSVNEVVEKEPARTDFVEYRSQTDIRLESLAFDQVFDLPGRWLARGEVGIFESAYGGFGAELFRFSESGRWGMGVESEVVWKRDVENSFKFRSSTTYWTSFFNFYYKVFPSLGVDAGVKLGRFLGGDWGGRLDVSRTFKYFTLGAWYSITDTSHFTASYNRDYRDKGVYLTIPFSLFTDRDHPSRLSYSLSPWTRDPGQTVSQINSLYPLSRMGDTDNVNRHLDELKW
jgi:hypothetical protein